MSPVRWFFACIAVSALAIVGVTVLMGFLLWLKDQHELMVIVGIAAVLALIASIFYKKG